MYVIIFYYYYYYYYYYSVLPSQIFSDSKCTVREIVTLASPPSAVSARTEELSVETVATDGMLISCRQNFQSSFCKFDLHMHKLNL
jgi:hypothetical protein